MLELHDLCVRSAAPAGLAWLDEAKAAVAADLRQLPLLFPQVPRRLGRAWLSAGERRAAAGVVIECGAWRSCDAAALALLRTVFAASREDPTPLLVDLHERGDLEERTMLLRSACCLPLGPWTGKLLAAVQRTNQVVHVAAGVLDSNQLARTLEQGAAATVGFGQDDFERMMLKLAFIDLPLARVFDAERHASPQLSRMLMGLATEREAAGRKVWADTNRLIAHAPAPGSLARLLGGLESGSDEHRLAAAEGLATLGRARAADPGLLRLVLGERLPREDSARVRTAIAAALEAIRAPA
ncbi:MAG: EboA domain-containing protein [Planctomycetes bacterium]|nr:EboA domain-containing protein [Planctomycetota bacterium]